MQTTIPLDDLPDHLLSMVLETTARQCMLFKFQPRDRPSVTMGHSRASGRVTTLPRPAPPADPLTGNKPCYYAFLQLVCKRWHRLMRDIPLPVCTLDLPVPIACGAQHLTQWLAEDAPLAVESLSGGQPRKGLFNAPHFRRLSGQTLDRVTHYEIRLPDDFGAAFPNVRHLHTVRRLPNGPLPDALESLSIECIMSQRPADLSAVLPPLIHLQELFLEHTLFDLAWLPPSVRKLTLHSCIVRRPFMEAILRDKRLFKSFGMIPLPGDRWRVMGEVGVMKSDGAGKAQLFRPPSDPELLDDADAGLADWDEDDGEDAVIPEVGAFLPAGFDEDVLDDVESPVYDRDKHEDYSDSCSGDSMASIDREELPYEGVGAIRSG